MNKPDNFPLDLVIIASLGAFLGQRRNSSL